MISLPLWWWAIICSKVSPISFSDVENHFLIDPVESESKRVIPLFPISSILHKSAGLSIAGVKSILKSPVWTILAHLGVSRQKPTQSGTEWLTLKNSTEKCEPIFIFSLLSPFTSTNVACEIILPLQIAFLSYQSSTLFQKSLAFKVLVKYVLMIKNGQDEHE